MLCENCVSIFLIYISLSVYLYRLSARGYKSELRPNLMIYLYIISFM